MCKLKLQGCLVDVALPRSADAAREPEPHLGTFLASQRRDLTVNALLYDPSAEQIIDHHGGLEDLEGRVLREVSAETFVLDPLRALRAVRFAGSLGEAGDPFRLSESLKQLCRSLSLTEEPDARIREELDKGLLESPLPGVTFDWMRKLGLLQDRHPSIWSWTGPEHGAWEPHRRQPCGLLRAQPPDPQRSLRPPPRPSAQDWLECSATRTTEVVLSFTDSALLDGSRPLEEPAPVAATPGRSGLTACMRLLTARRVTRLASGKRQSGSVSGRGLCLVCSRVANSDPWAMLLVPPWGASFARWSAQHRGRVTAVKRPGHPPNHRAALPS